MLREEILSLNMSRTRQRERITELEEELKKMKETQEVKPENNEEESEVPMAQRKRFTRVEMARVLMERNQYKVIPQIYMFFSIIRYIYLLYRGVFIQGTIYGIARSRPLVRAYASAQAGPRIEEQAIRLEVFYEPIQR